MITGLIAHLWQSTLFAGAASLLTLTLRQNPAEVRYRIWFIASIKFLVPFSLLVGIGSLVPRRAAAPPVQVGWVAAAQRISQPLVTLPVVSARVAVAGEGTNWNDLVVAAIALWACGFAAIAICWLARWKRVYVLRMSATPVSIAGGAKFAVPVMSAPGLVEPGIFGMLRPVLLLPQGIEEKLDRAQIDAILGHELCHVRRRDNLTAAIHMAVQAIFWFHPLVWWLGARLVDERERACDEEVLRLGSEPQVYAAGILNVCKLYTETPLVCVSGITGRNLRRRIEAIMKNRIVLTLNFPRKAALTAAGVAAFVLPIFVGIVKPPSVRAQSDSPLARAPQLQENPVHGMSAPAIPSPQQPSDSYRPTAAGLPEKKPLFMAQTQTPPIGPATAKPPAASPPAFDAASIKPVSGAVGGGREGPLAGNPIEFEPGRVISVGGVTALRLIMEAYHLTQYQVSGGPGWLNSDSFALEAKAADTSANENLLRQMLRTLLAERFKLVVSHGSREMPVYAIVAAKSGAKLHEIKEGEDAPTTGKELEALGVLPPPRVGERMAGSMFVRETMGGFASLLSENPKFDHPVVDKTGLNGVYLLGLRWYADGDITTAMQEQLGLRLESQRAPVDIFIIDHIEKPGAN